MVEDPDNREGECRSPIAGNAPEKRIAPWTRRATAVVGRHVDRFLASDAVAVLVGVGVIAAVLFQAGHVSATTLLLIAAISSTLTSVNQARELRGVAKEKPPNKKA